MNNTYHIAIAGCGIGGLATGILLAQQGHHVQIYDQFTAPAPVGSGLIIQPVGLAVLHALGIKESVIAKGAPITEMIGHEAKRNRRVLNVHYNKANAFQFGLGIHRASLFELLYQTALNAKVEITPNSKVSGTQLSKGKRLLEISDSSKTKAFDLVIDSSGAGSVLTPLIRKPLSYGAIWGTVDWPAGTQLRYDALSQKYKHASTMAGILPIGTLPSGTSSTDTMPNSTTKKAAVFWSLPRADYDKWESTPIEQWKAQATELWPSIEPFLNNIHSHKDMTMARYSHGTLKKPSQEALAFNWRCRSLRQPSIRSRCQYGLTRCLCFN